VTTSRRGLAAHVTAFLITRGTNAALALVQIALVTHYYSTSAAATFFVFWTLVWAGSVLLRFGTDQLVPKHVALAVRDTDLDYLSGFRGVLRWTLPALTVASVPLLVTVLPGTDATTALAAAPALLVAALAWAGAYVLMGLAKGYGHVALAGAVQGAIVPLGFTAVTPLAAALGPSWLLLAYLASAGTAIAALASAALVVRTVGHAPTRSTFGPPARPRSDRDRVPTGLLALIIEVVLWLPLWLGSAIGLSGAAVSGLYAALRVSGAFSWAFIAVVSVAVPMMARALAHRDYRTLADVLRRSAVAGVLVTLPLAALGIAFAPELLGLLDPAFAAYGSILVILIVARLFDAATGPLAECLVLGGRARWELANQAAGVLVVIVAGLALEPGLGAEGLALGTAIALTFENLVRLAQMRRLFRGPWHVPSGIAVLGAPRATTAS